MLTLAIFQCTSPRSIQGAKRVLLGGFCTELFLFFGRRRRLCPLKCQKSLGLSRFFGSGW